MHLIMDKERQKMALKANVILQNGLAIDNAYLRIVNVLGNKEKLTVFVDVFLNETTAQSHYALGQRNYVFTPSQGESAERWDKQAYEYLKTLDEYVDAIDC